MNECKNECCVGCRLGKKFKESYWRVGNLTQAGFLYTGILHRLSSRLGVAGACTACSERASGLSEDVSQNSSCTMQVRIPTHACSQPEIKMALLRKRDRCFIWVLRLFRFITSFDCSDWSDEEIVAKLGCCEWMRGYDGNQVGLRSKIRTSNPASCASLISSSVTWKPDFLWNKTLPVSGSL